MSETIETAEGRLGMIEANPKPFRCLSCGAPAETGLCAECIATGSDLFERIGK